MIAIKHSRVTTCNIFMYSLMIIWTCGIGVMGEQRGWMESGGRVQKLGKNEETGLH